MPKKVMASILSSGDIINLDLNNKDIPYVVLGNYGNHVAIARHVVVTNFSEWLLFKGPGFEAISTLIPGNKIVNVGSINEYIVTSIHGDNVIAMHSIYLDTLSQCLLLATATLKMK